MEAFASTLYLGLGRPAGTDALARSVDESRQACEAARAGGERVVRYTTIPTVSFVLGQLDRSRWAGSADCSIRSVRGIKGRNSSRRCGSSSPRNSAWGESASRLRIHRQTLTARIRRIEDLIGLSLADPDDRVAAWLALRASDG